MSPPVIVLASSDGEVLRLFDEAGFALLFAPTPEAFRHVLGSGAGDAAAVDSAMLSSAGAGIAEAMAGSRPDMPVVVLGGTAPVGFPVRTSHVARPRNRDSLLAAVESALVGTQASPPSERDSLSRAVETHLVQYFEAHAPGLPGPGLHRRVLREVERSLIALALDATRGNQLRAAALLGLNRNTLRKKIRDLDISAERSL